MHTDTKKVIAQSLLLILEHTPLEDVSVKALVDHCSISRQTFYYHFQDIFEVLEWDAKIGVEQGLAESLQATHPKDAIFILVEKTMARRKVIRKLLRSGHRAECEHLLVNAVSTYLQELFHRQWPNHSLPASDVQAFLDFHIYGLVGMLLKHCESSAPDVAQLVDQIYRVLSGEMENQLGPARFSL